MALCHLYESSQSQTEFEPRGITRVFAVLTWGQEFWSESDQSAAEAKRRRFSVDEFVTRFDFESIADSDDGGLTSGEESALDRQLLNSDSELRWAWTRVVTNFSKSHVACLLGEFRCYSVYRSSLKRYFHSNLHLRQCNSPQTNKKTGWIFNCVRKDATQ